MYLWSGFAGQIKRISNTSLLGQFHHFIDECIIDILVYKQPGASGTHLTHISEDGYMGGSCSLIHFGKILIGNIHNRMV